MAPQPEPALASILAKMAALPKLSQDPTSKLSSDGSHLTDAPDLPRVKIGPAANHLYDAMLQMYWAGVRRELPYILLTLRRWRTRDEYAKTTLPDEEDLYIHGYDTFLDQVSHSSRKFSDRYRNPPPKKTPAPSSGIKGLGLKLKAETGEDDPVPTYDEALENRAWDIYSEMQSMNTRQSIKNDLQTRGLQEADPLRRRARMLLQSAQFLDMDKVIEYRPPEAMVTFWKKPAPAQITHSSVDDSGMPVFVPQVCVRCREPIRGSIFRSIKNDGLMCEDCYRRHYFAHNEVTKVYKQCCLRKTVSLESSQEICSCINVRRRDSKGELRNLFPVDNDSKNTEGHVNPKGELGKARCGLYELTDMVAEAKYASALSNISRHKSLEKARRAGGPIRVNNINDESPDVKKDKKSKKFASTEFGSSSGTTTKGAESVPFYLSDVVADYPYGNVHMALRVGPLVIENGVSHTHGGVLITSRDPPNLQVLRDPSADIEHSLLLTGRSDRVLYSQKRPRSNKRYKTMMKQVVGGAFCGFFNQSSEETIIDTLLEESLRLVETGIPAAEKNAQMNQSVGRIMATLKSFLAPRIEVYLQSIVRRLLDPDINLRWSFFNNNCQMFCDNIIDKEVFGSMFAPRGPVLDPNENEKVPAPNQGPDTHYPLYLMSFVCRPEAYAPEKARSKYDVPSGLTEEYLLKFRYGRHEEADMVDALSEYWYDWGGFGGPLYPYQDVFPWDCTEAFNRYPVACGACNISKHVWAFPFDSWSLLTLHLARPRNLYPHSGHPAGNTTTPSLLENPVPVTRLSSGVMTDQDWFRNRLTLLLAQDVLLAGAAAMARCARFRESTLWLHKHPSPQTDRLKLGGIHRAQPFSHQFEQGEYHEYFIAGWAHLARPLQVAEYERLRDYRATRDDVGRSEDDSSGCGGGGGCGFVACGGGMGAGVACSGVAAEGQVEDSCGTGCVSSCGGGGSGGDGGDGCGGCGGCGG